MPLNPIRFARYGLDAGDIEPVFHALEAFKVKLGEHRDATFIPGQMLRIAQSAQRVPPAPQANTS